MSYVISERELLESTHLAKLWAILKVGRDGKLGAKRIKKSKDKLYTQGKLSWIVIKEMFMDYEFRPGNLLFMTPCETVDVIECSEELKRKILGKKYSEK